MVVVHQKEGIEAVHLASGRTICKVKHAHYFQVVILLIFIMFLIDLFINFHVFRGSSLVISKHFDLRFQL